MSNLEPTKFDWFVEQDEKSKVDYGGRTWLMGITYQQIKDSFTQMDLFDDDFNECGSGYCGL